MNFDIQYIIMSFGLALLHLVIEAEDRAKMSIPKLLLLISGHFTVNFRISLRKFISEFTSRFVN